MPELSATDIRALRGERTRAAFADELGVNAHTVYRWELPASSPHARRPRGDVLARLAALASAASPDRSAEVSVSAALQRALDGDWRDAEGVFLRTLGERARTRDDRATRVLAAVGLAAIELVFRADCRRAIAALGPALAPDAPALALAEAFAALAYSYPDGELFDLGRVHAHAARAEALAAEHPTARAIAVMAEVNAAMLVGNDDLLVRGLARAEAMATAELPEIPALFIAQLHSLAATIQGRNRLALERLERLLIHPRLAACPILHARVLAVRGMRLLDDLGDPEEALALARRARAVADDARLRRGVHTALALRAEAEALVRLVRLDEAGAVFAEADRVLTEEGFPVTIVFPIQGRFLLATGRADAIAALAERVGAVDLPSMRGACQGYAAWLRALACLARGDDAVTTLAAYAQAEQLCAGMGMMERDLLISHASAAVIDADPAAARAVFERAARAAERRPIAWATASLRRCEGTLLVEEGRVAEGRTLFESAVATFAASGDRLDAMLARYGASGMARILREPDGDARFAAAAAELAAAGLPRPAWIDRALARLELACAQPRARAIATTPARADGPSALGAAAAILDLPIQRLAVAGATSAMVMRELATLARELAGATVVPELGEAPHVFELELGDGLRLRLGTPAPVADDARAALRVLARVGALALEVATLRGGGGHDPRAAAQPEAMPELPGVIAASPGMRRLVADVARLASSRATVVITGESGAGKEVIAHALHTRSARSAQPYVAFNCAAVPHDLFEGQLFGYRKGAFTGAIADHPGVVRAADRGTVFLDEVGELPLDIQPKLLRFLDSGEVFPLGAQRPVTVDVRVIAATNRDLAAEVARGRFREDLYYRLQVVPLSVPPLRERREDIVPLARHFARQLAPDGVATAFTPDALAALVAHRWPGNVRELRNTIERAIAYATSPALLSRVDLFGERRTP